PRSRSCPGRSPSLPAACVVPSPATSMTCGVFYLLCGGFCLCAAFYRPAPGANAIGFWADPEHQSRRGRRSCMGRCGWLLVVGGPPGTNALGFCVGSEHQSRRGLRRSYTGRCGWLFFVGGPPPGRMLLAFGLARNTNRGGVAAPTWVG